MKNKKGITIGRILLYILFGVVFLSIIWVLVLTYREIAKDSNNNTKIECENNLRLQNEVDVPINLYDKDTYPFIIAPVNVRAAITGAYIPALPGTYSVTLPTGFRNSYKIAISGNIKSGVDIFSTDIQLFDSNYFTSDTYTFTTNQFFFLSFWAMRLDENYLSTTDIDTLNSYNIMVNEGQPTSYIAYNSNFQNASNYISNCYFTGSSKINDSNQYGGAAYPYGYLPFRIVSNSSSVNGPYGVKTDYVPSVISSSTLEIGKNISSLYSTINNANYYISWWNGIHYDNIPYNSTLYFASVFYECSTPIPVYLFNFNMVGADVLGVSNVVLSLKCNDDININVVFSTLNTFSYESILNSNPNIRSIYEFGFSFYYNSSIYDIVYSNSIPIQNKSWSDYSYLCNFYLDFINFYGDSEWNLGYQEGYRNGQAAANEALQIAYDNAMNQVNDLTSQVSDLTSRVNTQSDIITSLQNQINNANLGFKNFFFTMADVPFKTVSNVLGFEVFGLNLFQFFTGILTALGCIWLIKKFL